LRLVDHEVSKLVAAAQDAGMWDDAIFVFASDNGASCMGDGGSNYPYRGRKSTPFEGGLRTPAFVHSLRHIPESRRGAVSSEVIHVCDWLPTLHHGALGRTANLATPAYGSLDGANRWTTITDGATAPHAVIESSYTDEMFAVIRGDFKLLFFLNKYENKSDCCDNIGWWDPDGTGVASAASPGQEYRSFGLYDLKTDPRETTNLLHVTEADDRRRLAVDATAAELARIYCDYYASRMRAVLYADAGDAALSQGVWAANGDVVTYWTTDVREADEYPLDDYAYFNDSAYAAVAPYCR
jgi:arylsulfatase A-like enzyme